MEREESYRKRWALGLSIVLTVFIFVGFAFYKGYVGFGGGNIARQKSASQAANVISAENVISPIQSAKETFGTVLGELGKQYEKFKESVSDVFVPFVSGIEVYEKK